MKWRQSVLHPAPARGVDARSAVGSARIPNARPTGAAGTEAERGRDCHDAEKAIRVSVSFVPLLPFARRSCGTRRRSGSLPKAAVGIDRGMRATPSA
jgi:hypothetical protein